MSMSETEQVLKVLRKAQKQMTDDSEVANLMDRLYGYCDPSEALMVVRRADHENYMEELRDELKSAFDRIERIGAQLNKNADRIQSLTEDLEAMEAENKHLRELSFPQ